MDLEQLALCFMQRSPPKEISCLPFLSANGKETIHLLTQRRTFLRFWGDLKMSGDISFCVRHCHQLCQCENTSHHKDLTPCINTKFYSKTKTCINYVGVQPNQLSISICSFIGGINHYYGAI